MTVQHQDVRVQISVKYQDEEAELSDRTGSLFQLTSPCRSFTLAGSSQSLLPTPAGPQSSSGSSELSQYLPSRQQDFGLSSKPDWRIRLQDLGGVPGSGLKRLLLLRRANCSEYFPIFITVLWLAGVFLSPGEAAAGT